MTTSRARVGLAALCLASAGGLAAAHVAFAQGNPLSNTSPRPAEQPARPSTAAPRPAPPVAAPRPPFPQAPMGPYSVTQTPSGYEIRNLAVTVGALTYRVPRAEIMGSTLSRDELAQALDPASVMSAADRLRKLSASEITIPEIWTESADAGIRQTAIYRGVTLRDVADGKIGSVVSESGQMRRADPDAPAEGSFGRFEMSGADLGFAFRLADPSPSGAAEPLRPVYGSFALSDLRLGGGATAAIRVSRLGGRDFKARQTADGLPATVARFAAAAGQKDRSPEMRGQALAAFADILESFEFGSLEMTGVEIQPEPGKDGAGRIARISYTGGPDRPPEFRVDGFEASGSGNKVRIAEVAVGGLSFGAALAAMRDPAIAGKEELGPAEIRRLVPTISLIRLAGLEVEMPGSGPAASARPTLFSIGTVELSTSKPIDSIPTDVRMAVRGMGFTIGTVEDGEPMKELVDLGYDTFDLSLSTGLAWNEPAQELAMRDFAVRLKDMGSVSVRAVLGNVSKELFSPDQALASVALVGAQLKSVDLTVENNGLAERLLTREAARQGKGVDVMRRDLGVAAAIGIPAILGPSNAAKTLGQAIARFVAKPGRLTLRATAMGGGLGFADVAASQDPTQLLDKVELTATVD